MSNDDRGKAEGHIRPQGKGARGRLFENDFLEWLTRVAPSVALACYLPVVAALVYWNFAQGYVPNVLFAVLLFLAGVLFWTLFEYLAHRYVFHLAGESEAAAKFAYRIHGIHHEFPRDHGRLFMPPPIGYAIMAALFGVLYLFMGGSTFMFFAGFIMGYLGYAFLHYCMHRFRPPPMLKFLWRHHLQHHYKCPDLAFGVSSPLWDMVFRTMPPWEPAQSRLEEDPMRAVRT